MFKAAYFIAANKCIGCCFGCPNSLCENYKKNSSFCLRCLNSGCSLSKNFCYQKCEDNCFDCKNAECMNNQNFNPGKSLRKNC